MTHQEDHYIHSPVVSTTPSVDGMDVPPWVTYAEQLRSLGYGLPLWVPDPSPGRGPVRIGDVGWVHEGEFLPLFNALRGPEDGQPRGAVPVDFKPLDKAELLIEGPRQKISQTMLCSRSIRLTSVSAELLGSIGNGSGAIDFSFNCHDDAGALLLLSPSVEACDSILLRRRIAAYINANFDSWLEFANAHLGLDLREEDIRFVCGTKMTSQWAVAAFHGSYRDTSGTVTGAFGDEVTGGSARLSMSISNISLPGSHHRVGPPRSTGPVGDSLPGGPASPVLRADDGSGDPSFAPAASVYDQCVFIHTCKRKKRLPHFLRFLKAGAGPHNCQPEGPDEPESYIPAGGITPTISSGTTLDKTEYFTCSSPERCEPVSIPYG
ncbi:hypothetical protein OH77DRAFT_1069180 [Trametes cingulata]|nr:hypothetical protein OH77DRAFT_1069180 [Trametes cingulata]